MISTEERRKIGKRSRLQGAEFERKVRKDLESKGFICSKWMNNLECIKYDNEEGNFSGEIKLIPAKASRFRLSSTGYPDYFCYRLVECLATQIGSLSYDVIFVEVKTSGYLDKIEREKARWYLDNNYCSKFLIAKKVKEKNRVKVVYEDFNEKYGKK